MKLRGAAVPLCTAVIVLAGGWFVGASATNSGWITWVKFSSSGVGLCGQHAAYVTLSGLAGVEVSGRERALNKPDSTCTTSHGRPADYIRVYVYMQQNGATIATTGSYNNSGEYTVGDGIFKTNPGYNCFQSLVKGREFDSDTDTYLVPSAYAYSGTECNV